MTFAIRPSDWELPLFLHALGAMLLVAALVVVLVLAIGSHGNPRSPYARLAFRWLLLGVLPAYVLMRIGAEWVSNEEGAAEGLWIDIGYITTDAGALLTLFALGIAGFDARRARIENRPPWAGRAVAVLAALLLVAYVVAIWAMTAKPL